jgi:hypothetical protein
MDWDLRGVGKVGNKKNAWVYKGKYMAVKGQAVFAFLLSASG